MLSPPLKDYEGRMIKDIKYYIEKNPLKTAKRMWALAVSINDTNIFSTERLYNGPINIKRLNVKLVDDKGNIMNFYQADWSFSLIAKQLYQF